MTAQPVHRNEPERVPRNAEGIAEALSGVQRIEFYRELLAATPEEVKAVLLRWWGRAVLLSDPDRQPRLSAALSGTGATATVEEMLDRRRAAGLPVE